MLDDSFYYLRFEEHARAFLRFLAPRAGLGDLQPPKPPLLSPAQAAALTAAGAAALAAALRWRLYASRWTMFAAALAVLWLSTSGVAYTYIRGMPWTARGQDGRTVYMLSGQRGAQLGAEGLVMGSSYVGVSALALALTHGAPRLRSAWARRVAGYGLAAALGGASLVVLELYAAKTGHRVRAFGPLRWAAYL